MPNLVVNEGNSVLTGKSHLWTMKMQRFLRWKKSVQLLLKTWKGVIILENVACPLCTHPQRRAGPVTETTYSAVSRAPESGWKWNLAPISAPSQDTPQSLQQHPPKPQSCLFNSNIRSGSGKKPARYEDTVKSFTGTKCRLIEKSCGGKKSTSQVEVPGLFLL